MNAIFNGESDSLCAKYFFSFAKKEIQSPNDDWSESLDKKAITFLLDEGFSKDNVSNTIIKFSPAVPSKEDVHNILEECTSRAVEVPPPDYQSLKKKNQLDSQLIQQLQHRCHTLEHILAHCDVSPMSNIIKEYKSMSDFYLLQLIKEVEIYRVNSDERSELLDFVNYLHAVTSEIEDMLIVEH